MVIDAHACCRGLLGLASTRQVLFVTLQPLLEAVAKRPPTALPNDNTYLARFAPFLCVLHRVLELRRLYRDWETQATVETAETGVKTGLETDQAMDEQVALALLLLADAGAEDIAQDLVAQLIRQSSDAPLARVRVSLLHMLAEGPLAEKTVLQARRSRQGVHEGYTARTCLVPSRDKDT